MISKPGRETAEFLQGYKRHAQLAEPREAAALVLSVGAVGEELLVNVYKRTMTSKEEAIEILEIALRVMRKS